MISIEPEPDDSLASFTLKPLVGEASEGVKILQDLDNQAEASNPTGLTSFE